MDNLTLLAIGLIAILIVAAIAVVKKEGKKYEEIEIRLSEIDTKLKDLGADTRTGRRRIFPRQRR